MKKEMKEIKTFKQVFISKDGREFDTEADCKAWETSYEGTLDASMKTTNKMDVNGADLCVPYAYDDSNVFAIKPKNLEEITLINAWIDCKINRNGSKLTIENIDKVMVLNFGYDWDYCDVYDLEKLLEQQKDRVANIIGKFNGEEEIKNDK